MNTLDDFSTLLRWLLSIKALTLTPAAPVFATTAVQWWFERQLDELADDA